MEPHEQNTTNGHHIKYQQPETKTSNSQRPAKALLNNKVKRTRTTTI